MNDAPSSSATPSTYADAWLVTLLWCALTAAALILRPLLPIDETRYLTVAWEMRVMDSYMVPHLNGELYSHKPPLFFWLMNLGWMVGGVDGAWGEAWAETWARLVAPLFGLGALFMTMRLARALWPEATQAVRNARAALAPLMLLTGLYWAVFTTMSMFDTLVVFGALVALLGTLAAWRGFANDVTGRKAFWKGVALMALGLGIGGLAKGPAILVHTLPAMLLAPWWGPALAPIYNDGGRGTASWKRWYAGVGVAVLGGVLMVLAWAVPAAILGGEEYARAIFIGQTANRMVESFAHKRPVWWFVQFLPVLLLPWTLWPRLWRAVGGRRAWHERRGLRAALSDGGARFLIAWGGATLVVFSLISGKQLHYLLPMYPALALLAAWLLTHNAEAEPANGERGHRVPVLFFAVLAIAVAAAGRALPLVAGRFPKLPDWAFEAAPLWMVPAAILALAAAFARTGSGRAGAGGNARAEARLVAVTAVSALVFLHMAAEGALGHAYDLSGAAKLVRSFQDQGRPVAYIGKYHGEFQFLGRLEKPLDMLDKLEDGRAWAAAHPTGVLIDNIAEGDIPAGSQPFAVLPYRGKALVMWNAEGF